MTRTYFFIFAILAVQTISAQEVFQRSYGGYGSDYGRAVIECSDGGYLIVGSTNSFVNASTDVYLLRVDEAGDYLWGKNIGLPDHIEWGIDLAEDTDGNFILAGYTDATTSGTYDGLLVKTNHTGNVIWTKTYGGTDWAFFESMVLRDDGNILIAGQRTIDGNPEGWILMTDPDGTALWETLIPGNGKVNLTGIDTCPSGAIVFTGYTENVLLDTKTKISGSLNENGEIIWASTYPEFGKVETGKCACTFSNEIVSIGTLYDSTGNTDFFYTKISSQNGLSIWIRIVNTEDNAIGSGIAALPNGNILLAASVENIGYTLFDSGSYVVNSDGYLISIDFSESLGGSGIDLVCDIVPTSIGGYITVGSTNSFGNNYQVHLCKIDSVGTRDETDIDYLDTTTKIQSATKPTQFNIFPNPAKSTISVELEIRGNAGYQILDLSGKTLISGSIQTAGQSIEISQLKAGFYFIRIESQDKIFLSRFVKID